MRLKLVRYEAREVEYSINSQIRVRFEIKDADGIEPELFLMHRQVYDPLAPNQEIDVFTTVASPYDIAVYPVNAPSVETSYPFFRVKEITLDFPSLKDADDAYEQIKLMLQELVRAMRRMQSLVFVDSLSIFEA